jgi:hypothetical protein
MDQRHKIEMYMAEIRKINADYPHLAQLAQVNFDEYERFMAAKLPRFKEDYKTLFKMAIREYNKPDFQGQLNHYLSITQSVLNGARTLDDATKQVATEQYNKYVAPVVGHKKK